MSLMTDADLDMLEACKSEYDWNTACNAIKAKNGGQYPADWYLRVVASGMMGRIVRSFGGSTKVTVSTADGRTVASLEMDPTVRHSASDFVATKP